MLFYLYSNRLYSISETLNVFTIPFASTGIEVKLIIKSPSFTNPFSLEILLISTTVSSVLKFLS
jgi:hypothetical protein